jgi:hypothetical protein
MTTGSYKEKLRKMSQVLTQGESFSIESMKTYNPEDMGSTLAKLPQSIADFYTETNGFILEWEEDKFKNDPAIRGMVNILHLKETLQEWKDIVWFDFTPKDDPLRHFKIIDYVSEEVFIGFFDTPKKEDCLYFFSISDRPVSLKLDMYGYIEMLCLCYGFKFWQRSILSILHKKEYPETIVLKKYMPQIFIDFKWDAFENRYKQIKLQ